MKKIGIISCRTASNVCTGAGCFNAFNSRSKYFNRYIDEDVILSVFMNCNGCKDEGGLELEEDLGLQEKLQRLNQEHIEVMHVGICRIQKDGKECERMNQILKKIKSLGIPIVYGTH